MNKGFTLVEILAVVAVLALVMVFAIPTVLDSQKTLEEKIMFREKDNIVLASEIFALDLDDITSEIYNCKNLSELSSCNNTSGTWTQASIRLKEDLIDKGYFKMQNNCNGTITITKEGYNYAVKIEDDFICY